MATGDTRSSVSSGVMGVALTLSCLFATPSRSDETTDELARQATDPTASLMAFNFIADYTGGFHGPDTGDDDAAELTFRPAIPFRAFGANNILRLTLPYQLSGRGEERLGDVSLFDIAVFGESWGRWGVGVVASFATSDAAVDDVAVGPAIGGVWAYSKKLNLGVFSQNVFAGDTAITQLQPVVAYQLGGGWSLSAGDLQFAYDWERGRWLSLPIGLQIGRVTSLFRQPIRLAVNPQYNLKDDRGLEEWSISFTFTLLAPGG